MIWKRVKGCSTIGSMRQPRTMVLLCCLCATAGTRLSGADQQQQVQEDVLVLDSDDFPREIERPESPALVRIISNIFACCWLPLTTRNRPGAAVLRPTQVQFLIPDCKICHDMAEEYRKVARNLKVCSSGRRLLQCHMQAHSGYSMCIPACLAQQPLVEDVHCIDGVGDDTGFNRGGGES